MYNMTKDKVKDIMWVKKYTGTATYVYPEATASVTNTISIWDLRETLKIRYSLNQVTQHFQGIR
ncbi:MAG: hypothetical protein U5L09_12415 [Bacteroidales bacterium]|nr:hypothetical protein [Bacteroidales bacterium]